MNPADTTVVYVTREIERALGKAPDARYRIVASKTLYGESVKKRYPDYVTLVDCPAGQLLGTTELLAHQATRALMASLSGTPAVLVFKNTQRVEAMAKTNGWTVLNPASTLSERVENKLSQLRWLGPLAARYLPPHAAKVTKTIAWRDDPIVIQWNHGHTGDGTILVKTIDELRAVQDKFPERMARLSTYIAGPSFTVNAVVTPERVIIGTPSYQITGLAPFTDNAFSTVGNDWGAARKLLTGEDIRSIESVTRDIGARLQADGWKGLFGVDLIRDEAHGRICLIEINARQPASTTFESSLQEAARVSGARGLTTMEAHLRALLGQPIDQDLIPVSDGAQIVQRVTKNVQSVFDDVAGSLQQSGFDVVAYQNTAPNSDLLRIQSAESIMDGHDSLNARGHGIMEAIKSSGFNIRV